MKESLELTKSYSSEKLLRWQYVCLLIAVMMIPLVGPPSFKQYLGPLFFYGQPASVPILIGLILATIMIIRDGKARQILFPIAFLGIAYLGLVTIISIHAIVTFDAPWSSEVFGASTRVDLIKALLLKLGIEEELAYKGIIFAKDIRSAIHEFLFLFCFIVWIALLYIRDTTGTFRVVRKAVIIDFCLLAPYCLIEVFHLYGFGFATKILSSLNPLFYVPYGASGWYPPLVSWSQVRGVWTEPAYFSFWLAFAVPFLLDWLFQKQKPGKRFVIFRFVLLVLLFAIWFMTYARSSIWMMCTMVLIYFIASFFWRNRSTRIQFINIIISSALAFFLVSNCGPADIHRWVDPVSSSDRVSSDLEVTSSHLFQGTVVSSLDSKSRSTPSRIQYWTCRFEIFKDSPFLGVGDVFEPYYEAKKYKEYWGAAVTDEIKGRIEWIEKKGLLKSDFGGNTLGILEVLACRGMLGAISIFAPIVFLFICFLYQIYKGRNTKNYHIPLCLGVSSFVCFMSVFPQGLYFFDIWPAIGLLAGYTYLSRREFYVQK